MSLPNPATLIQRLDHERSRGRLWRARELAQQYPRALYDPELWLRCGETFLEIHDPERAGRLLFLAGSRDPAHGAAIALYLARHDAHAIRRHLGRLPSLDVLPAETRLALAERGIVELPKPTTAPDTSHRLGYLLAVGLALALLTLTAIGALTVYRWLTG